MAVKIVTDSTASLTTEEIKQHDLTICTLFIVQDGKSEPEIDLDTDVFYSRLEDIENLPTTSQPATASFVEEFTRILDAGDDVVGIFVSGGLSGTSEGARAARGIIEEKDPALAARIAIVDSQSCGGTLNFPVIEAAKLAETGASLEEVRERAEYVSASTRFIFAPKSLEHLARGGRIGRASAMLGGVLKLVPLLGPDKHTGAVHTYGKVRTQAKALKVIVEKMDEDAKVADGLFGLYVHYIGDRDGGLAFKKDVVDPFIAENYPEVEVRFGPVPPTIGTHVGPAIGIAYCCNAPVPKENI